MDTGTWHAQLARGHWFSHLPPDLQRSLLGAARLRVLTAGQYLFRRGDLTQGGDLGLVQTFEFTCFLQDVANPPVVALCVAEQFVGRLFRKPGV